MTKLEFIEHIDPNWSKYILDDKHTIYVGYSDDDIEEVIIESDNWYVRLLQLEDGNGFVINHLGTARIKESWVSTYKNICDKITILVEMQQVLDIVALELGITYREEV